MLAVRQQRTKNDGASGSRGRIRIGNRDLELTVVGDTHRTDIRPHDGSLEPSHCHGRQLVGDIELVRAAYWNMRQLNVRKLRKSKVVTRSGDA